MNMKQSFAENESPRMGSEGANENQVYVDPTSLTGERQPIPPPDPNGHRMSPGDFFCTVYGDAVGCLAISHKKNVEGGQRLDPNDRFETELFDISNLRAIVARIMQLTGVTNVYYGVCLRHERLPDGQRGSSRDVSVMPGLWAEFDVKMGGFESKETILAFLKTLPLRPTMTVDSGGGYHCYWLFREPWTIEDEDDRAYVAALAKGWAGYMKSRAAEVGAGMDSVHDLARVLRVPGTFNLKGGKRREVTVVSADGPRHNPSDFDDWMDSGEAENGNGHGCHVEVRPDAEPPALKFNALFSNNVKFKGSWGGNNPHLKDQSPSAYCFSLATLAALAGWTDQEICDLLVAWRRTHGATAKPAGWYAITIGKARKGHEATATATQDLERVEETPEIDEKLAGLSSVLGLRITKVVKYQPHDPSNELQSSYYRLETEKGSVSIPETGILTSHSKFKNFMFDRLQHLLPVRANQWDRVLQQLLAVMTTEEAPLEASPLEEVRQALNEYIENKPIVTDPLKAYDANMLLRVDGHVLFNYTQFKIYCVTIKGFRVGNRSLSSMLVAIGSQRHPLEHLVRNGKRTRLIYYRMPAELL